MSYDYTLQPTRPADTGEKPSLGAGIIRNLKQAIIERLTSWIYGFDLAQEETQTGLKHAPLINQTETVATPTSGVKIYSKTNELFAKDSSGNETQITKEGKLNNTFSEYVAVEPLATIQALYSGILYVHNSVGKITVSVNDDLSDAEFFIFGSYPYSIPIPRGYYFKAEISLGAKAYFC